MLENFHTNVLKWRAYVMSGGVPTRLHAQYLPQGKEKLLKKSNWTSTTPVIETSESIEPNDTDLELNAIAYTFF